MNWVIPVLVLLVFMSLCDITAGGCHTHDNTTCASCVRDFSCYWCEETQLCGKRPSLKPSSKDCDGKWYAFSQCSVSGNLILILLPLTAVVMLVAIGICVYCCCCRRCCNKRAQKKWEKDDMIRKAKKRELQERHKSGVTERMSMQHDEIRNKYGLFNNEHTYEGSLRL